MLAILHELSQHIEGGVLRKGAFKIVYVAPMKALAQEVQETFQRRLGCLGLVVKELTGDMQLTKREIKETQVIVTTPEKWLTICIHTINFKAVVHFWFHSFALLCLCVDCAIGM